MNAEIALSASLEDYLEAIYNIIRQKNAVRAKDIAARLKVSNASVTGALRALSKRKFLNYAPYDVITLTPAGEEVAREVVRKHEVLRDFMVKVLAVEYRDADVAACRLEHDIPKDIVDRLVEFIEFIETCPLGGPKLIEGFHRHLECRDKELRCKQCVEQALDISKGLSGTDDSSKRPLALLKPGEAGRIKRIRTRGPLRRKLLEMGLTPGSLIKVERVAPMGDPVEVNVKGYHLSLRRDEIECIEVEAKR